MEGVVCLNHISDQVSPSVLASAQQQPHYISSSIAAVQQFQRPTDFVTGGSVGSTVPGVPELIQEPMVSFCLCGTLI
jgi:hypothetical protein